MLVTVGVRACNAVDMSFIIVFSESSREEIEDGPESLTTWALQLELGEATGGPVAFTRGTALREVPAAACCWGSSADERNGGRGPPAAAVTRAVPGGGTRSKGSRASFHSSKALGKMSQNSRDLGHSLLEVEQDTRREVSSRSRDRLIPSGDYMDR